MPGVSRPALRAFAGRYLIALLAAVVLTATGVAAVNREIDDRVADIVRVPVNVASAPPEGANYLLLGSDTREFVNNPIDASAFGDPTEESGKNSDTLMIAHIEPRAQHAQVVSFPRDLLVEVPDGNGQMAKINSFFGEGGADGVVKMLDWNFGIPIHHYVEVDFETFRQVVDAIGTVNVWFEHPTRDELTGLDVQNGPVCKAMNGDDALHYVRSRFLEEKIDGEWQYVGQDAPDLHRIERQQDFIRKLLGVAIAKSISNPFVAYNIADDALQYTKLDEGVGRDQVNELIRAFKNVDVNDPNSVKFETIPTKVNPSNAYGSSLLLGDDAQPVMDQLRTFGDKARPASTVVPAQVKVTVREGADTDVARVQPVTAELAGLGFVTQAGSRRRVAALTSEIRYPPSQLAAAKLLSSYVPDAGLFIDPTIPDDHIELLMGATFDGFTVPETTSTAVPADPATTPPPATPDTTAPMDPRAAACT